MTRGRRCRRGSWWGFSGRGRCWLRWCCTGRWKKNMAGRKQNTPQSNDASSGRFAYEGLERVIHEKARLSIMSSLAAHPEGVLFNDLKDLCKLTDGNLSRHLQLLQESKLVEVWKGFKNNRPQTLVR